MQTSRKGRRDRFGHKVPIGEHNFDRVTFFKGPAATITKDGNLIEEIETRIRNGNN